MKKVALLFATVCLWGFTQAQESVVKISGLDAAFGKYELSYERTFNEGMNNIQSSGRLRNQKKWPNILTKGSFQVSFAYITHTHNQTFGTGLTAVVDTNSNHHLAYDPANPDEDDIRVVDNPSIHTVERSIIAKTSGIAFEAEYRSYFKTYKQNIGDAPRGWYVAPFFRFQTTTLDFDDNTLQETNHAMNYLMYGDQDVFNGNFGPWEGDEDTGNQIIWNNPNGNNFVLNNYDVRWYDVSFKQSETVIAGGLALGRQWLFGDKVSLDVQIGPQYKLVTKGERIFNGNDTWNIDAIPLVTGQTLPADWYLFNKFGDVYSFSGSALENDINNGYYGMIDEDGNTIVINGKADNPVLTNTTGFFRELPSLTDFGKLETYRLKVRLGYAF